MNKPYFAEYIPVKEEIKKGQIIKDSAGNIRPAERDVSKEEAESHRKAIGLVGLRLFLCSRDKSELKEGDRVILRNNSEIFTIKELFTLMNDNHAVLHEQDTPVFVTDIYPIVGEISPDALGYVKKGQEFDKEDWQYDPWVDFPDNTCIVEIKGPCGHFH